MTRVKIQQQGSWGLAVALLEKEQSHKYTSYFLQPTITLSFMPDQSKHTWDSIGSAAQCLAAETTLGFQRPGIPLPITISCGHRVDAHLPRECKAFSTTSRDPRSWRTARENKIHQPHLLENKQTNQQTKHFLPTCFRIYPYKYLGK